MLMVWCSSKLLQAVRKVLYYDERLCMCVCVALPVVMLSLVVFPLKLALNETHHLRYEKT
jgi:hypothetical protein